MRVPAARSSRVVSLDLWLPPATSIAIASRGACYNRRAVAILSEPEVPAAAPSSLPQRVFSPIARDYDRPALVLSLFQYRRWHRFLLSRLELPPGGRVLDMATGTGAIAFDLLQRADVEVVGADVTRSMLVKAMARASANGRAQALQLLECTAEVPPFARRSFDAVTFAYLLRYVADVPATLCSLANLVKPGGTMVSLDFAVPRGIWYPLWRLYVDAVLPNAGWAFSREWREVGAFLGPSIRDFHRRWPEQRLINAWRDAGFVDVRSRRLSLDGAIVIWGRKAA
jgi:demethylmenaquinone methyltransferase / 2-methoxy-6-polyprenyl-1,4-benzoquinol methylase